MADENNNLITLREYEYLYKSDKNNIPKIEKNKNLYSLNKENYEALERFIKEYEPEELNELDNIDDCEEVDLRNCFQFHTNDTISVKNYVGLIQLESGFQIEILPKVDLSDNKDDPITKTKEVFLEMLEYLDDFPYKIFSDSSIDIKDFTILEIFIKLFVEEVKNLVKQGLKSSYITIEDNVPYFKGKFLVNQHLKHNLCHKERFYMAYDEFNLNRPENKLIKASLMKLQRITTNWDNSKEIKMLLNDFEMVGESLNYNKDLSKVKIDRNTLSYANIIQWVKVFLFNKSFTNFSGDGKNRALLFDMGKVFERYVAKKVEEVFTPNGWTVYAQAEGNTKSLFDKPPMFKLKPDLVIKMEDKDFEGKPIEKTVILDTKWKALNNDKSKNYGISQSDMYQMYAYSKKYKAENIWLLYPQNEDSQKIKDIEYKEFDEVNDNNLKPYQINTTVRVFFIDVAKINDSIKKLLGAINSLN